MGKVLDSIGDCSKEEESERWNDFVPFLLLSADMAWRSVTMRVSR